VIASLTVIMSRSVRLGALIAGLVLVAGCGPVRHMPTSPSPDLEWNAQVGVLPGRGTAVDPKVAAMGDFVTGEVALNDGNYDVGLKAFRSAVAHDPQSPLLRQRLAMLLVRKGLLD